MSDTRDAIQRAQEARAAKQAAGEPTYPSRKQFIQEVRLTGVGVKPHQEQRLEDVPRTVRNVYIEALAGNSRAAGVKAFCLQCAGYDRASVENCPDTICPLYPYRPFK